MKQVHSFSLAGVLRQDMSMQQLNSPLLAGPLGCTASQCDKCSMSCSPLAFTQRCSQQ